MALVWSRGDRVRKAKEACTPRGEAPRTPPRGKPHLSLPGVLPLARPFCRELQCPRKHTSLLQFLNDCDIKSSKPEASSALKTGFLEGRLQGHACHFLACSPAPPRAAVAGVVGREEVKKGTPRPPRVKAGPSKELASCQRKAQQTGRSWLNKCFHFGIWRQADPGGPPGTLQG